MKKAVFLACLGLTFSTLVSGAVSAQALKEVKTTVPRNSVFVLNFMGGKDAGIFAKHGIDLKIDSRPFRGHMAGLPAKEVPVASYAGTAAIARINQGLDLVIIGGGLTVMQEVFVRKDASFKKISDLRGKKFSSWSTGAGAFKSVRAAILDGFGLDVLKDTEFVQAAAPALIKFLERGNVDSMFNISSLTIAAAAQPDKYRSIFAPNDYWKDKTGYPIVWSGPIVAWREWVDADRDRAKHYVRAVHESMIWLRNEDNLASAIKKYGKLAAVKNQAQAEIYRKWLGQSRIFLARWDREVVDSQWKFLEMAKERGVLDKIPNKATHGLILDPALN
jgi:ABC-type nitrate/sulfonate/bicarbonate transport system substrate-binding protein